MSIVIELIHGIQLALTIINTQLHPSPETRDISIIILLVFTIDS
jgi:hypothetical protein